MSYTEEVLDMLNKKELITMVLSLQSEELKKKKKLKKKLKKKKIWYCWKSVRWTINLLNLNSKMQLQSKRNLFCLHF